MDPRNWPGTAQWADSQAQKPDPMEMLRQLMGNSPDFSSEANQRLAGVYDPQYASIDQQTAQTSRRAAESDAKLKAMYAALGKDIKGDRKQVTANFTGATKDVNRGFAQGRGAIQGAYQDSNNELVDLFNQLGIQDAAKDPRTLAANMQDSSMLQGLLDAQNSASTNALAEQKSGSLNFNTAQQGIAKQEGALQRSALQQSLQDKLATYAQSRMNLDSQRAGALADLTSQLENNWTTQQSKLADQAYSSWQDNQKANAAGAQKQPSLYQQYQMQGPVDRTYGQAAQLFGVGDNRASQAVALLSQLGGNENFQNGFQFMEAALENNRNSQQPLPEDQLRSLAGFFWQQMKPGTIPTYN
jgi:hypothetical protein